MNNTRTVQRLCAVLELGTLWQWVCCLSLPLFLVFTETPTAATCFWAVGAALPVTAVCLLCKKLKKHSRQLLASVAVGALAVLCCRTPLQRVFYAICTGLYIVPAVLFPRPRGNMPLTTPRVFCPVFHFMDYALGMAVKSALLQKASVFLAFFYLLLYLLYRNLSRLRSALHDSGAKVSSASMIQVNRRMISWFLALVAVAVIAVPWILRKMPTPTAESSQVEPGSFYVTDTQSYAQPEEDSERTVQTEHPFDLSFVDDLSTVLGIALAAAALACAVLAVVSVLRQTDTQRQHDDTAGKERMTIQRLDDRQPPSGSAPEPKPTGYDRRIRRLYAKLIASRTNQRLSPLTPRELEAAAGIPATPHGQTLHRLYEKARYASDECTRDDYLRLKDAVKAIRADDGRKNSEFGT